MQYEHARYIFRQIIHTFDPLNIADIYINLDI